MLALTMFTHHGSGDQVILYVLFYLIWMMLVPLGSAILLDDKCDGLCSELTWSHKGQDLDLAKRRLRRRYTAYKLAILVGWFLLLACVPYLIWIISGLLVFALVLAVMS